MSRLFSSFQLRSITFRNRIFVSPMCQYSSQDGHPNDWHLVHLGSRAVGGAGLVIVEATAVSPEGRISPDDSGIWSDAHTPGFKRIVDFMKSSGAVAGIQLAHAGRKASTWAPWKVSATTESQARVIVSELDGGWKTLAPSAIAFTPGAPLPREMSLDDLARTVQDFEKAAVRSLQAGFQVLEVHMAHGYLLHQFLSPLSNHRQDNYGGSLENRMRFPLEVVRAVRKKWPSELPLFVRISATDWVKGPDELKAIAERRDLTTSGWNLSESLVLCKQLKELGVDLIDCSTGGAVSEVKIPVGPNYQVPFAESIRRETQIATAAVGMITDPMQAEAILFQEQADAVMIARELLREPYWPHRAAKSLGVKLSKPNQYERS